MHDKGLADWIGDGERKQHLINLLIYYNALAVSIICWAASVAFSRALPGMMQISMSVRRNVASIGFNVDHFLIFLFDIQFITWERMDV